MTIGTGNALRQPSLKDFSAPAQAAHQWFRLIGRAIKICRLYKPDYPIVVQVRDQLLEPLAQALSIYGAWRFRITPNEIFLLDEAVVRPSQPTADAEGMSSKEETLPFLFYRDGIRALVLLPGLPRRDLDALFDALLASSGGVITHADMVTLMWQANTTHIQIEAVPLEQTIYLSSRRPGAGGGGGGEVGQSYAWTPSGNEIRAELGQASGAAQGLHRDTFDDWPLPLDPADVPSAYQKMLPAMEFSRMRLSTEWVGERSTDWTVQAPDVIREILGLAPGSRTRSLLAHSVATWLVGAIQRSSWAEAQETLRLLRELDPDGSLSTAELTEGISGLDTDDISERLDESETDEQACFFALVVALGRPALDLACSVMAKARKSRTRAAACTMLCYLCSDEPELLAPYITDHRWYVARNAVFILGQIGGAEVASILALASEHPEPRVRRQVVAALGNVPRDLRAPILVAHLDTQDPQLLSAALNMLTREKNSQAAETILKQIAAPDFESRSEDNQRTLFNALAEVADDAAIPALKLLLHKGGWFARRTLERSAAARTLQRLGSEAAQAALAEGLRSRSEAVRLACQEALATRKAA